MSGRDLQIASAFFCRFAFVPSCSLPAERIMMKA
jgi:hypothetical protein